MFLTDPLAVGALNDSTADGDLVDKSREDVPRKNTAGGALVISPVDDDPVDNSPEDVPG